MLLKFVLSAAATVLLASEFVSAAPTPLVANDFIVVLKSNRTRTVEQHAEWIQGLMSSEFNGDTASITKNFDFGTWQAYALSATASLAETVSADADVDWVQPIRIFKALGQNNNPTPGLRRSSVRKVTGNEPYTFPDSAGAGVDAFIVDTGIKVNHPEFEGRAIFGKSFVNNDERVDANGHGTHVSGTIGSRDFGMAPKATLIGVRVLDEDGNGRSDAILSGLEFVLNTVATRKNPSVVNLSLGGGADRALDRAVQTLINNGITVVAAAGNDGVDACGESPARVPDVITVGAIDPRTDILAPFSNTGTCVDINAPGVRIKSTWIGNSRTDGENGITNTISGTSMACPHVVGAVALMLGDDKTLTPAQVSSRLKQFGTQNALQVRRQTPNLLLFNGGVNGFSAGGANANNNANTNRNRGN